MYLGFNPLFIGAVVPSCMVQSQIDTEYSFNPLFIGAVVPSIANDGGEDDWPYRFNPLFIGAVVPS